MTIRALSILVLFAVAAARAAAQAQAPTQMPTPTPTRVGSDSLHRLIAGFLAEPFRNGPRFREVLDSAEVSPHVAIRLSAGVVPWMCELRDDEDPARALRGLFLGAFVAGNMRAQLERGAKGDQPLAGAWAVLDVYGRAKARVPDLAVPTLERWLELDRAGTLDAEIADVAAHPPADCGGDAKEDR